jgi:hypothetical protein
MINSNFAMVATLLFVIACCGVDALFRRRKNRIGTSTCGGDVGDDGSTVDCGGGDGGGCD